MEIHIEGYVRWVGKRSVFIPPSLRALSLRSGNKGSEAPDVGGEGNTPDGVVGFECNMIGNSDNLINELPDHILVSIISLLDLKQAAQTSILSRRWVKLWTYTGRLVFDDPMFEYIDFDVHGCTVAEVDSQVEKSLQVKRCRFINWVNNTLKLYQGTNLDEFTVCFDLDGESCMLDIDRWIIFALEKRSECLHLDFVSITSSGYTLTIRFLCDRTLDFLKVIRLISLNVSGEVVEYILSACPLLQVLRVQSSESLVRLQVSGPSLKLKTLEIICCPLEYIEISATNLVSFSYDGSRPKGNINNVPNLVEVSIAGECAHFLVDNNHQFSGFLSQLETLVLDLKLKRFKSFPDFPNMKNLKHLEMLLDGYFVESLLFCADLLEASSLLQRLTLKVSWTFRSKYSSKQAGYDVYRDTVNEQEPEPVHEHLKVIQFIGFKGGAVEVELLLCLLGRAVSLKSLIIDPCSENFFGERTECEKATTVAKQLKSRLPPCAELVILGKT